MFFFLWQKQSIYSYQNVCSESNLFISFLKKTVQESTLFLWLEQEIKNFQEFLI